MARIGAVQAIAASVGITVGVLKTFGVLALSDPLAVILILLGLAIFLSGFKRREVAPQPGNGESGSNDGKLGKLRSEQRAGRRLAGEAAALEPIGNLELLDDLIRRYNDFEGRVADLLADSDDLSPEWRVEWLRDPEWHDSQVTPISREQLDAMARMIGHRVRLIDGMIRALEGRPALRGEITRLMGRGRDLSSEANLAGNAAERERDRRAATTSPPRRSSFGGGRMSGYGTSKLRLPTTRSIWTACQALLTSHPPALGRFTAASRPK